MAENIIDTLKSAKDELHGRVRGIAAETQHQIEKNAPRYAQSARESYDGANGYVADLIDGRELPLLIGVGILGFAIGVLSSRRG